MSTLTDLVVLDLSRILAGPYCTQMLADLGATVWKLESPKGDDTRQWGPPFEAGESAYFLSVNRGKKSLALNLKDVRGQELVRRLAARADVLVENFKVGDLARYGLGYDSLAAVNPGLIYASITGFGQTGPRAQEPGYDGAMQGLSGIMSLTGEPGRAPVKVGVAWIDILAGLHSAVAILAALHERSRSGKGQHLDIALFDVALASLVNQAQSYLMTGDAPVRRGSAHPQIVPYQAFEAKDAWFILAVGNDEQFVRACKAIGLNHLAQDERFSSNAWRVSHRDALIPELSAHFKTETRRHWLDKLGEAKVPSTPVNDLAEAFSDPQVEARGMRRQLNHSLLGELEMPGSPFAHFSRSPAAVGGGPPLHGEHSVNLLREVLELSPEEIADLESAGVVTQA